jgi:putative ABC transport system permease protein
MIRNYLKVAWRNLTRNKAHAFINIAGLSVGLACSLLILLWVQSELSIDAYHANAPYLYKVYEREYYDNKIDGNYDTPGPLAAELKQLVPEVLYSTPMEEENELRTFRVGNKVMKQEGTFAGADLFKMFSYKLLAGSAQTALSTPASIAISKKMATLFYGDPGTAIGKSIRFENRKDFIVSAVFDDLPENSSRKFEYIINWDSYYAENPGAKDWRNSGPLTYVMLRPDADPARVAKKIIHFHYGYDPHKSTHLEYDLQRADQVYLHSHFENGKIVGGRIEYVHLFSIVAIFVLLIACINFMNLTTAQSVKRAREIGVRKVMGAVRGVLIKQFIGESLLLTTFSVIVAIVLMSMVLPAFNHITQKQMAIPFGDVSFWLKLSVLTLVTGLIAGSYPALFLSSFNPVRVLKGSMKLGLSAVWFRKGLVIFQFVLSAVLIIATIVVSKQVNFIQTKNVGYDRQNLVYVPIEGDLGNKYDVFKNATSNIPGVTAVTEMGESPTFIDDGTSSVTWEGKDPNLTVSFAFVAVGYDFIHTMRAKLLDGRDFSSGFPADSNNYLINEAAKEKIGYANPVGRTFNQWGVKGTIVGLVKDFHIQSLHDPIRPLVIRLITGKRSSGYILVRTQAGKTKEALAGIKALCTQLNPDFPFTYTFSDEEYLKLYKSEQVVGRLSNVFAFLAIFISCMGLLGLAMFTAEQRIKEIGIRKVLGASILSLFTLLSSEFLMLVTIAFLIATPVAWYAMSKWVQAYAYHAPVQWWMFAASGVLIVLIALATVSFQAIKAALINPIKSLRSE